MENAEIAAVLTDIADILEILGENPFRIRSYRQAVQTIEDLPQRCEDMAREGKKLTALAGIGKSIAQKIHELIDTGKCLAHQELLEKIPPGLTELLHLSGLGPRKVKVLSEKLQIGDINALREAAQAGKIRHLEGMGEKTEQNILRAILTHEAVKGRWRLKDAMDSVDAMGKFLDKLPDIVRWEVAGSFRRRKETVGDLDVLIHSKKRAESGEAILKYREIAQVLAHGEEKTSVVLRNGMQVDFRFFDPHDFGSGLMYFTGSKEHNIALRDRAQRRGLKINEYGLFRVKDNRRLAGKSEKEIYDKLKLAFIPPELRERRGEIDAAADDALPTLVTLADIRGDLHCHSTYTDGNATIEEMIRAARRRGYKYIAITDHSKAVRVAGGLDEKGLRRQLKEIDRIRKTLKDFDLLSGTEVDILKDGSLDLDVGLLAEVDCVIASVHSYFGLPEDKMTARLVKAFSSGVVHIFGHPFSRLLGTRPEIKFDVEEVFAAAKAHNVAMEINSHPERLDLMDNYCRMAKEVGLKMAIATDAHTTGNLDLIQLGVYIARRGWLEKKDVLNTATAKSLRQKLKR
ncbi:MAG: DNA polymerase/3'-5' exonuclease PolX [Planctomycetia bacterium]|nr:DNA polymerase/3'-5' exonuclease PolX [Planctomycetia bacterium]